MDDNKSNKDKQKDLESILTKRSIVDEMKRKLQSEIGNNNIEILTALKSMLVDEDEKQNK